MNSRLRGNDKTKKPPEFGRFLKEYKLILLNAKKRLNDGEDKSKDCCSPETIGIKSIDKIIHEEYHQDIDDEGNKAKGEPIERRSNHLEKKANRRIHETEYKGNYERCCETVYLYTRDNVPRCEDRNGR